MTIAVAQSDSARGRAALLAGAEEALRRRQPLVVLHIIPGVDEPTDEDEELRAKIAAQLVDYPDLEWTLRSGPEGFDTAEAILSLADEAEAELLVIGSRKRRPVGKLILGSVVQRVLLESLIPVLVVKAT